MRWYVGALLGALLLAPCASMAQSMEVLPIGTIGPVEDRSPTTWAMSGMDMIYLSRSDGAFTPLMRTLRMDARTVEILSRTQAPPLTGRDVHTLVQNGRQYVTVRRYMLAQVLPQDARAERTTIPLLAARWARAVQTVLPQVAPLPNRYGI